MQIQKLKLGQQNNDEGSINLTGANKKATLKCKKIIIKTLAKLYESVYCHSMFENNSYFSSVWICWKCDTHAQRGINIQAQFLL